MAVQKKTVRFIFYFVILFMIYQCILKWDQRNDGFELSKIQSNWPYRPECDFGYSQSDIDRANKILSQPFRYLAHGFQCYVFISEDGNFFLKFFRHQRMRVPQYLYKLPQIGVISDFIQEKERFAKKRIGYICKSFQVATKYAPEETGLLYVHINPSKNLHPQITIYDKLQTKYELQIDEMQFVLQKKALQLKDTLCQLVEEKRMSEAKVRIDQIFALLAGCAKKGVLDTDGALIRKNNMGFLEDRAIYIDSGKLTYKESIKTKARFKKDLQRLRPLEKWLDQKYPELFAYYIVKKADVLHDFKNDKNY